MYYGDSQLHWNQRFHHLNFTFLFKISLSPFGENILQSENFKKFNRIAKIANIKLCRIFYNRGYIPEGTPI